MNKVRCTGCRGTRQVMKLGGIMGHCNLCQGEGEINEGDIPEPVKPVEPVNVAALVKQVENVAPVEPEAIKVPDNVSVKVNSKRAIYKRKTIGK